MGITAYGVLSRGLLSGAWTAHRDLAPNDFRAHSPRFGGDNLTHNLAPRRGARTGGSGARRHHGAGRDRVGAWRRARTSCRSSARADATGWPRRWGPPDLQLTAADLAAIEAAVPAGAAAGGRYPDAQLATMDSER